MSILAKSPDLTKIINKAIKRIGENHALARDNKGVEMKSMEIEEDRKEFRKGRTNEIANETMDSVIEESLKAVVSEMAEKMMLENTIGGMVKDAISEQVISEASTLENLGKSMADNPKQWNELPKDWKELFTLLGYTEKTYNEWINDLDFDNVFDFIEEWEQTMDTWTEEVKARAQKLLLGLDLSVIRSGVQGDINEERKTPIGNTLKSVGAGFVDKQGTSNSLTRFKERQEMGEQETVKLGDGREYNVSKTAWDIIAQQGVTLENLEAFTAVELETLRQKLIKPMKGNGKEEDRKMTEEINALFGRLIKAITGEYPPADTTIDESTTDTIKKLVNKKLKDLAEARGGFSTSKHPGLDTYEKSVKKSKTENDKAMKDTDKKFKEYNKFEYNDNPEFPHQEMSKTNADGQFQYYRNNEEDQEFVDDFAHPGLIDFDINNLNLDRLTKYLEGSSETGNAQTDKDGKGLGNVVPSDLGKRMMKSAERRKEKIAQQKASMSNLRGYTPDVQKVKQVKEGTDKDMEKMKKLWSYNKNTQ